eukprot:scaffold2707_cov417-Prasinococcus_capsulatus_cf.AAC.31
MPAATRGVLTQVLVVLLLAATAWAKHHHEQDRWSAISDQRCLGVIFFKLPGSGSTFMSTLMEGQRKTSMQREIINAQHRVQTSAVCDLPTCTQARSQPLPRELPREGAALPGKVASSSLHRALRAAAAKRCGTRATGRGDAHQRRGWGSDRQTAGCSWSGPAGRPRALLTPPAARVALGASQVAGDRVREALSCKHGVEVAACTINPEYLLTPTALRQSDNVPERFQANSPGAAARSACTPPPTFPAAVDDDDDDDAAPRRAARFLGVAPPAAASSSAAAAAASPPSSAAAPARTRTLASLRRPLGGSECGPVSAAVADGCRGRKVIHYYRSNLVKHLVGMSRTIFHKVGRPGGLLLKLRATADERAGERACSASLPLAHGTRHAAGSATHRTGLRAPGAARSIQRQRAAAVLGREEPDRGCGAAAFPVLGGAEEPAHPPGHERDEPGTCSPPRVQDRPPSSCATAASQIGGGARAWPWEPVACADALPRADHPLLYRHLGRPDLWQEVRSPLVKKSREDLGLEIENYSEFVQWLGSVEDELQSSCPLVQMGTTRTNEEFLPCDFADLNRAVRVLAERWNVNDRLAQFAQETARRVVSPKGGEPHAPHAGRA